MAKNRQKSSKCDKKIRYIYIYIHVYTCSHLDAWRVYLLSSLVYSALYTKGKVLERQGEGALGLYFMSEESAHESEREPVMHRYTPL